MKRAKNQLALLNEGLQAVSPFEGKNIRKIFKDGQWYFVLADCIEALTDTIDVKQYIKDMRKRDATLNFSWGEFVTPTEVRAKDGKFYKTNCVTVEALFRIVQSIPSLKAEPFKRWLAEVGFERIQEHQDPTMSIRRAMADFRAQGRNEKWIEIRIKNLISRKNLTQEWHDRGVHTWQYAVLTNVISEETFGISPEKHQLIKQLSPQHQLRDHMTDIELTLTTLGEQATRDITKKRDVRIKNKQDVVGYKKIHTSAKDGGKVAGKARVELERKLGGTKIVSPKNFLNHTSHKRNIFAKKN